MVVQNHSTMMLKNEIKFSFDGYSKINIEIVYFRLQYGMMNFHEIE